MSVKKARYDTIFSLEETCRTCLKNDHRQIIPMIPIFETELVTNDPIQIADQLLFMKLRVCIYSLVN